MRPTIEIDPHDIAGALDLLKAIEGPDYGDREKALACYLALLRAASRFQPAEPKEEGIFSDELDLFLALLLGWIDQ